MPREEMTDDNMLRLRQIAEKFEQATGQQASGVRNLEAKIDEAIAAHGS